MDSTPSVHSLPGTIHTLCSPFVVILDGEMLLLLDDEDDSKTHQHYLRNVN